MSKSHLPLVSRRALLVGAGALTASATTGCFGSFGLTGLVYDFNAGVSSKWLRWLLFLGMVIIPVYGVVMFVDALVLNSIEFWSGSNPVKSSDLGNGHTVRASATEDPRVTRIEHLEHGRVVRAFFVERQGEHEIRLMNDARREVARVRTSPDGSAELLSPGGKVVATLSVEELRGLAERVQGGDSPAVAIGERLHTPERVRAVASLSGMSGVTTL